MHRLLLAFSSLFTVLGCTSAYPLSIREPRYPDLLRTAALTGELPVRISVDRVGNVRAVQVDAQGAGLGDAGSLFALAVRRSLRDAHFAPARRVGIAVPGKIALLYRFSLTRPVTPLRADEVPGKADSLPVTCPAPPSLRVVLICVPANAYRGRIVH